MEKLPSLPLHPLQDLKSQPVLRRRFATSQQLIENKRVNAMAEAVHWLG